MTPRFVLATANPDKAAEIVAVVGDRFELLPRPATVPEVEESAETLEGNALLKARAVCRATGDAAIADDTGLEVDVLGGRPGVRSSRYAGEQATYADNVARLLQKMENVPEGERGARFRTVATAVYPGGREVVVSGQVEGRIATRPSGDGGFGYDPVFVPADGDGRTLAELTADEKHAISHRGRAFRKLIAAL